MEEQQKIYNAMRVLKSAIFIILLVLVVIALFKPKTEIVDNGFETQFHQTIIAFGNTCERETGDSTMIIMKKENETGGYDGFDLGCLKDNKNETEEVIQLNEIQEPPLLDGS